MAAKKEKNDNSGTFAEQVVWALLLAAGVPAATIASLKVVWNVIKKYQEAIKIEEIQVQVGGKTHTFKKGTKGFKKAVFSLALEDFSLVPTVTVDVMIGTERLKIRTTDSLGRHRIQPGRIDPEAGIFEISSRGPKVPDEFVVNGKACTKRNCETQFSWTAKDAVIAVGFQCTGTLGGKTYGISGTTAGYDASDLIDLS